MEKLTKTKNYGLIILLGLTVRLTSFSLVELWIHNELSYDRYHPDVNHIYRITSKLQSLTQTIHHAVSP